MRKEPAGQPDATDTRDHVYDPGEAAVDSQRHHPNPNGGKPSVSTIFFGGLNSFLENFLGRDKAAVKLAIISLVAGQERGTNAVPYQSQGGRHLGATPRCLFPGRRGPDRAGPPLCETGDGIRESGLRRRRQEPRTHFEFTHPTRRHHRSPDPGPGPGRSRIGNRKRFIETPG